MEPKTEIWKRAESSEYGFDACNKCPAGTEDAILAETGCGVYETCVPPANVSCNWTTSPHWKVCKSTMSCISKAQSEKTRCPYTRKKGVILETDTDTRRSGHVAMETGVSDAAAGAQEAGGWTPPPPAPVLKPSGGARPSPHLDCGLGASRTGKEKVPLARSAQAVAACCGSPERHSQCSSTSFLTSRWEEPQKGDAAVSLVCAQVPAAQRCSDMCPMTLGSNPRPAGPGPQGPRLSPWQPGSRIAMPDEAGLRASGCMQAQLSRRLSQPGRSDRVPHPWASAAGAYCSRSWRLDVPKGGGGVVSPRGDPLSGLQTSCGGPRSRLSSSFDKGTNPITRAPP